MFSYVTYYVLTDVEPGLDTLAGTDGSHDYFVQFKASQVRQQYIFITALLGHVKDRQM